MKKIIPIIVILLCGCENKPVASVSTNNNDIHLELLFEHEGYKVYRFHDNGNAHYYVTPQGMTSATVTESVPAGKTVIITSKSEEIETSK